MRKPFCSICSILLVLLSVAVTGGTPARAADNGSWSVFPVASEPAARPYFLLSADPGTAIEDEVAVTNRTGRPLTFRLYAADAYNTARDGGFAVRTRQERQRGVGAWARPAKDRVTVPAHGRVTVPFTLRVPETAEPGDHPGALVALDERIDAGEGTVEVGVRRAVGARIYLRVGGPTVAAVAVEKVRISHHQPLFPGVGDSTATVSYILHNTGNVTLNPKVRLTAEGLFGRTLLSRDLAGIPSELLPGQRVRLSAKWRGAPQFDWGDVTLTASARDTRESASTSFFALPWLLAVVLGAGIAAAAVVIGVRRRDTNRDRNRRRGRGRGRGEGGVRERPGRVRPSVPAPPSPPEPPTPSRHRSSPSARPSRPPR